MRKVQVPMPDGTTRIEDVTNPKHKWIVVDVRKTGNFINGWWGYASKRSAVGKLEAWQKWQAEFIERNASYNLEESTYHLLPVIEEQ